jgi:hypothetical protein
MWILTICCEPSSSYSLSSSSSIWACGVGRGHFARAAIECTTDGTYRTYGTNMNYDVGAGRGSHPDRGRGRKSTLLLNPRTSNIRKNKSPNYGRQPIPAGGRSYQPERTISTRNCPELTSATRRIDGLIDLFLPHKPHTGSAVAGPPDECKSRPHLSSEWQVLRR